MTTPTGRPPGRKTYTRLAAGRRVPPEYELVSTDLHYNHPMRFELPAANAVVAWHYRYREGCALRARDWERFSDPRRTTYRAYTVLQDGREDVVDGLLREVDDTGYDRNLDQEWVRYLIDDTPANAEVVSGWIGKWSPLASRALEAFAGTLAEAPVPLDANAVTARITSDVSRDTDSVLKAPPASAGPDTGRAVTDG